jgi:plasmid stabilization system protein ParE
MLPVDYLPAARRDFDESFDWYAKQSPQAAIRFANAIDAALIAAASDPLRFAAVDAQHRECLVRRFPFRVIYRIVQSRILVVGVAPRKTAPRILEGPEVSRLSSAQCRRADPTVDSSMRSKKRESQMTPFRERKHPAHHFRAEFAIP